jgi:hypothetical protein
LRRKENQLRFPPLSPRAPVDHPLLRRSAINCTKLHWACVDKADKEVGSFS